MQIGNDCVQTPRTGLGRDLANEEKKCHCSNQESQIKMFECWRKEKGIRVTEIHLRNRQP